MLVYSYWLDKNSVVCQANNSLLEENLQHCKQNQVGSSVPEGLYDAQEMSSGERGRADQVWE